MKILLILFACVVGCVSVHAQYRYEGPIKCLRHADTLSTPDSMRTWRDDCSDSPTYTQLFARGRFRASFDIYAIPLPSVPDDSVVEVGWEAIDPKFTVLRAAFHELEQRAGHFVLRKIYPSVSDSGSIGSRMFTMWFDDYVSIDSVESHFEDVRDVLVYYLDFYYPPTAVPQRGSIETGITLSPNPCSSVTVLSSEGVFSSDVRIMNSLGEEVARVVPGSESHSLRIDVSTLPPGWYVVLYKNFVHSLVVNR